jgi:hypothetical protein
MREGAMILHTFSIDLTAAQREQVWKHWLAHAAGNCALIAQPIIQWGPCKILHAQMHIAILDQKSFRAVGAVIKKQKVKPCKP